MRMVVLEAPLRSRAASGQDRVWAQVWIVWDRSMDMYGGWGRHGEARRAGPPKKKAPQEERDTQGRDARTHSCQPGQGCAPWCRSEGPPKKTLWGRRNSTEGDVFGGDDQLTVRAAAARRGRYTPCRAAPSMAPRGGQGVRPGLPPPASEVISVREQSPAGSTGCAGSSGSAGCAGSSGSAGHHGHDGPDPYRAGWASAVP